LTVVTLRRSTPPASDVLGRLSSSGAVTFWASYRRPTPSSACSRCRQPPRGSRVAAVATGLRGTSALCGGQPRLERRSQCLHVAAAERHGLEAADRALTERRRCWTKAGQSCTDVPLSSELHRRPSRSSDLHRRPSVSSEQHRRPSGSSVLSRRPSESSVLPRRPSRSTEQHRRPSGSSELHRGPFVLT